MPRNETHVKQQLLEKQTPEKSGNGAMAMASFAESKIEDDKDKIIPTSLGPDVQSSVVQLTVDKGNLGHSSTSKLHGWNNRLSFKIKARKNREVNRLKKQAMLKPTLTVSVFNHRSANKNETNEAHTGGKEELIICNICKKTFFKYDSLIRHMKSHSGDKVVLKNASKLNCSVCEKSFVTSQNVKKHMSTIHIHTKHKFNRLSVYKCGICGKSFVSLIIFIRHTKLHDKIKRKTASYKCNICFKRFFDFNPLKIHCQTHKGKNVQKCRICKKLYYNRMTLSRHMKYHKGKKSFTYILANLHL